jgi:YggT family protein
MSLFWAVVAFILYLYLLLVLARFIVEVTRQFARSWRPVGVTAVGLELVYTGTDPPLKLLRKLLPPVRIGSVSLDLSITVLLLAILALRWVALTLI